MLDQLKRELKNLNKSEDYKTFKKENKESHLCSCSLIDNEWQLDFFSKTTKLITSFKANKLAYKEEKQFSKEQKDLEPLDITEIKTTPEEIIELIKDKHPEEQEEKTIIILQTINSKPTWNITLLTKSFNVLNSKINAINKEVIEDKIQPILSFKAS